MSKQPDAAPPGVPAYATARERLFAFLEHWPPSQHDDEIYRLYVHDEEHVLRKSDILGVIAEERRSTEQRIADAWFGIPLKYRNHFTDTLFASIRKGVE